MQGINAEPLTYFYETLMRRPGIRTEKSHSFILLFIKSLSRNFQ